MEHGTATLASAVISAIATDTAMIAAWTLVAVAFLALGTLAYIAVRSRTRRVGLDDAVQAFRSLDIEAFRNLVDPAEEKFLRDNLPPRKFREIKRRRAWAALLYAWEAGQAATMLASVGHAAQRSSDAAMAASGLRVAESAFQLRLQTIAVCLHLLAEILLPNLKGRSVPPLVDQYGQAAQTLFRLGRFSSGMQG